MNQCVISRFKCHLVARASVACGFIHRFSVMAWAASVAGLLSSLSPCSTLLSFLQVDYSSNMDSSPSSVSTLFVYGLYLPTRERLPYPQQSLLRPLCFPQSPESQAQASCNRSKGGPLCSYYNCPHRHIGGPSTQSCPIYRPCASATLTGPMICESRDMPLTACL